MLGTKLAYIFNLFKSSSGHRPVRSALFTHLDGIEANEEQTQEF